MPAGRFLGLPLLPRLFQRDQQRVVRYSQLRIVIRRDDEPHVGAVGALAPGHGEGR